MLPSHLNFKVIKRTVSIEHVLNDKGLLASLKRQPGTLVGPCPIHHGDNPRAFVVNLNRNIWRCFTACDSGGDVVELVRRLDHRTYRETAEYLASLAQTFPSMSPLPLAETARQKPFQPFSHRLPLQHETPFLQNKGIHSTTARRFDAGRYLGQGFLKGCIGVRLHDPQGCPLGYAGRRLDPQDVQQRGKWKFPVRLPRNHILYNFHRIRSLGPKSLLLTECPWSVMRLDQISIPAVALLGLHLSPFQQELIAFVPQITLMLDADSAGRNASARLQSQIGYTSNVRIASLPDGLDPDDLSHRELQALLKTLSL